MRGVHPDDLERAVKLSVEVVKGERQDYAEEHRFRVADGSWKWLLSRGRITERDAQGRALRMTGINLDITGRKRAEQSLREAEERYRALVEMTPNGVLVHCDGVIEYANPAAARILRAPSTRALLGLHITGILQADQHERFAERLRYLQMGPGGVDFEERQFLCRDGSSAAVEVAAVSYLERGRLVVQAVLRDVTEQREARQALAEREKRFSDVVEASGEYVWETDAQWRYTYLSARAEGVLGYMRAELLGRTPRDFMPLGEARALDEWFERNARDGRNIERLGFYNPVAAGKDVSLQLDVERAKHWIAKGAQATPKVKLLMKQASKAAVAA